ncbi:MAG: hypothetical protein ACOC2V_05410, partial [Alkalispirochaeta sp.]
MNREELVREITKLLSPSQVNTDPEDLYDAAADRYKKFAKARKVLDVPTPTAIVYPASAEEVANVL